MQAEYGLSSLRYSPAARASTIFTNCRSDERHRFAQKGWVGGLFGDWRLSGNIGAQTGTPFTAQVMGTSAGNTGSGGVFSTRADQICNPNAGRQRRAAEFL